MAKIEHLTEESLPLVLAETPGPLIVDFWAEWCGPCVVVGPLLERLAREHPEVRIAKVDVDEDPWLALRYGVAEIPTLIRFDDGAETGRVSGALRYERLLAALRIGRRRGWHRDRMTGGARFSSRGRSSQTEPGSRPGRRR